MANKATAPKKKTQKISTSCQAMIALIVVIVLLTGVIAASVLTYGFTAADPYNLFHTAPANDKQQDENDTNSGSTLNDSLVFSALKQDNIKLISEPLATADGQLTTRLTATLTPDNVSDKSVDWTVEFVNPASEWASGKTVTDYVTVKPTTDGALTADVLNLQAFGEQIVIKCTSRVCPTANAICTVDYIKKYEFDSFEIVSPRTYDPNNDDLYNDLYSGILKVQYTITDGTIEPQTDLEWTITFSDIIKPIYTKYLYTGATHTQQRIYEGITQTDSILPHEISKNISVPMLGKTFADVYEIEGDDVEAFYRQFFNPIFCKRMLSNTSEYKNNVNVYVRNYLQEIRSIIPNTPQGSIYDLTIKINQSYEQYDYSNSTECCLKLGGWGYETDLYDTAPIPQQMSIQLRLIINSITDFVDDVTVDNDNLVY